MSCSMNHWEGIFQAVDFAEPDWKVFPDPLDILLGIFLMIPNYKIRFDFQQSFPVDLLGPAYDMNSLNFKGIDTEFSYSHQKFHHAKVMKQLSLGWNKGDGSYWWFLEWEPPSRLI